MKLGFLSDCHGNPKGLQKCLKYLVSQHVESIYFLGDMVGYLPEVEDCYRLLKEYSVICLAGNHDAMMAGTLPSNPQKEKVYLHEYAKSQLPEAALVDIASWKPIKEVAIAGRQLLLVHGSPWNPLEEYVYQDSDFVRFSELEFDAVFMGHTHRPFIERSSIGMLIVNVGSCGLPRDRGNMAACAIYDASIHSCEIFRLEFNANYFKAVYSELLHTSVTNCLNKYENLPMIGKVVD